MSSYGSVSDTASTSTSTLSSVESVSTTCEDWPMQVIGALEAGGAGLLAYGVVASKVAFLALGAFSTSVGIIGFAGYCCYQYQQQPEE